MREARIQKKLRQMLELRGGWVIITTPGGGIPVGTPDLIACVGGRFIALEIKQPGRYPEPAQRHVIQQIKTAGGVAEVVRSEEDLVRLLNNLDTGGVEC